MNFYEVNISVEAIQNVTDCLWSTWIGEGEHVKQFEAAIEEKFGYRGCVAVNSCTSAIHLALIEARIRKGDEVILPAQTFVATAMPILYCGAKPVFADIYSDGTINVDDVERKITNKTTAVIVVSWGGNPCELDRLEELCKNYALPLIQDNAHALGAMYNYLPITEFGNFSCFSFQATKLLTTGDGGLLVCKDKVETIDAKRIRWFGIDRELDLPDYTGERQYDLWDAGYKYNMNDIDAAIGLGNLKTFDQRLTRRYEIACMYDTHLPKEFLVAPRKQRVYYLYDLLVPKRKEFIEKMKSKDIPVSVVHVGIDRNTVFGDIRFDNVVQRYWDNHHICLPINSQMTDDDVEKVIDAVNGGW